MMVGRVFVTEGCGHVLCLKCARDIGKVWEERPKPCLGVFRHRPSRFQKRVCPACGQRGRQKVTMLSGDNHKDLLVCLFCSL